MEYQDHWIGREGPVSWPGRSRDINPRKFFLQDYVKDKGYI